MSREEGQLRERARLAWWVVGVAFGVVMLFVFYAFAGTFALGLFMYYATRPIYDRLEARLGYPGVTAIASLFAILLPILLLVAYAVAVSALEVVRIAGNSIAGYEGVLQPYLDLSSQTVRPQRILELARENRSLFTQLGGAELFDGIANIASAFGLTLLQLFVALAFAFYLLRDDDKLVRWFRHRIGGEQETAYTYGRAVDSNLQTVYFGSILHAFVVALVAGIAYNLANVVAPAGVSIPLPTLLGLLTGIASLVPHIGTKLVYVPITLFLVVRALGDGITALWFPLAFVLGVALVLDVATEALIRRYTGGRTVHVGLMLFAYIFGPLLFGWYGLFIGPLLLVLLVQFNRIVLPELMQGESIPAASAVADSVSGERAAVGESGTRDELKGREVSETEAGGTKPNGTESNGGDES
ncbi:Predicted PurR-regulated permease PerM [Haladaptatus litoreus]|uniref:Predicted PurR-regulated permease PerM n=1 Tax=Haladaptatus litoreus TaxID=553468 RepID=A0A1N7E0D8_9EURY|nr:AI-2E family transporter [Haladaptatus litoreus]SIR81592.1 Predicted PurR-regulated permease PerM [Haladaptatus litoreus]